MKKERRNLEQVYLYKTKKESVINLQKKSTKPLLLLVDDVRVKGVV